MFVDSGNFTVNTCDMKKYICLYLLLEESVKFHQISTLFQVDFEVCLKELCTVLNAYREHSRDSRFANFSWCSMNRYKQGLFHAPI